MGRESLGTKIRRIRKRKKMTHLDLSDSSGISVSAISLYERDIRDPKIDTLARIAEGLGVELEELVDNSDFIEKGRLTAKEARSIAINVLKDNELCEEELNRVYDQIDKESKDGYFSTKINIKHKYQDYIHIKLIEGGYDYSLCQRETTITWKRG